MSKLPGNSLPSAESPFLGSGRSAENIELGIDTIGGSFGKINNHAACTGRPRRLAHYHQSDKSSNAYYRSHPHPKSVHWCQLRFCCYGDRGLAGSEIGECICISGGIALEVPALSFVAVVNFGKLDIGAVAAANRTKGKICGTLSRERVFSIWNNDLVGVNLYSECCQTSS